MSTSAVRAVPLVLWILLIALPCVLLAAVLAQEPLSAARARVKRLVEQSVWRIRQGLVRA